MDAGKPIVYVETSVVSYLTARPSRNPGVEGRRHDTRAWWDGRRGEFRLVTSRLTVEEASAGDPQAAADRLRVLADLELLDFPEDEVAAVVERLVASGPLPEKARGDAAHVAIAALNGADYLLTWNCTHLANAALRGRIAAILGDAGLGSVTICTPWELMEPSGG